MATAKKLMRMVLNNIKRTLKVLAVIFCYSRAYKRHKKIEFILTINLTE